MRNDEALQTDNCDGGELCILGSACDDERVDKVDLLG